MPPRTWTACRSTRASSSQQGPHYTGLVSAPLWRSTITSNRSRSIPWTCSRHSARLCHWIPSDRLSGRAAHAAVDLRRVGSGNVGAANVYRTSGLPMAIAVMLADAGKGAGAMLLAGGGVTRRSPRAWRRWSATSTRCGCGFAAAKAWPRRAGCSACCRRCRRSSPRPRLRMVVAHALRVARVDRGHASCCRSSSGSTPGLRAVARRDDRRGPDPLPSPRQHGAPVRSAHASAALRHMSHADRGHRSGKLGHRAGRAPGAHRPRGPSVGARCRRWLRR